MEADRRKREAEIAKLEADLFAASIDKDIPNHRWCILVQPPGRRVGKTTLLRKLIARYVAAGKKVYALATCGRAFTTSGFGDAGAINLDIAFEKEELFQGDRTNRVYIVDEASFVSLPLLNVVKEDVRTHPDSIYIETCVKDGREPADWITFPRVILPMPQAEETYGDYFPHLENATADEKRAFVQELSSQAN